MRVICVLAGDEFGKKQERWFGETPTGKTLFFLGCGGRVPAGQEAADRD